MNSLKAVAALWGWFGASKPVEGNANVVLEKLAQHTGKNVFIVDFHI